MRAYTTAEVILMRERQRVEWEMLEHISPLWADTARLLASGTEVLKEERGERVWEIFDTPHTHHYWWVAARAVFSPNTAPRFCGEGEGKSVVLRIYAWIDLQGRPLRWEGGLVDAAGADYGLGPGLDRRQVLSRSVHFPQAERGVQPLGSWQGYKLTF